MICGFPRLAVKIWLLKIGDGGVGISKLIFTKRLGHGISIKVILCLFNY